MAQNVVGLDLGSHSVKAVVVNVGLRGAEVVTYDVEPVKLDANGNSLESNVVKAAGRLMMRLGISNAPVFCAVAGEFVSFRKVSLPASTGRRAEQVLKFELDEVLPFDIDDGVFDFVEQSRSGDDVSYLASVVSTNRVKSLLESLEKQEIDPREIGVAPLSYENALSEAITETTAIVDLGHRRTNVLILGDGERTCRTILRGAKDLTERVAQDAKVSFAEAEEHKKKGGLRGGLAPILTDALNPLVRELSQTFVGHLASGGTRVKKVLICGGGALLSGLTHHLKTELGVPVEVYNTPLLAGGVKSFENPDAGPLFALAHALSNMEQVPKWKRYNVRKGELAFKGDSEVLKKRIIWLSACVVFIILSWIFASMTRYLAISEDAERLEAELKAETKRVLGVETTNMETIKKKMESSTSQRSPVPARDAFHIVVELSKRIPTSVIHDVELLDIKPKKIKIRGIVDSTLKIEEGDLEETESDLSPTDLIKQKLSGFEECFTAFRIPKVQNVNERQKYEMEIDSKCP